MALYVKNGGSWGSLKSLWVKQNGSWQQVKKQFMKVNGEWVRIFPSTGKLSFFDTSYTHTWQVPQMIDKIWLTAIAGGGGAGNVVDGGRNDDYGAGGCGASGQWIRNYPIKVNPFEIISIRVGTGGGNAGTSRDRSNVGGTGGNTYISGSFGTLTLFGGAGGTGGVGDAGNRYYGGYVNPTTWTDINGRTYAVGSSGQEYNDSPRRAGGVGFLTVDGVLGSGMQQTSYSRSGGHYYDDMDATDFGGGGAGILYSYIRQDNGHHPGWGGKGKQGLVTISW